MTCLEGHSFTDLVHQSLISATPSVSNLASSITRTRTAALLGLVVSTWQRHHGTFQDRLWTHFRHFTFIPSFHFHFISPFYCTAGTLVFVCLFELSSLSSPIPRFRPTPPLPSPSWRATGDWIGLFEETLIVWGFCLFPTLQNPSSLKATLLQSLGISGGRWLLYRSAPVNPIRIVLLNPVFFRHPNKSFHQAWFTPVSLPSSIPT